MLTRHELAQLEQSLHDTQVLTVYLDGMPDDTAVRGSEWRRRLDRLLAQARSSLTGASHAERAAFDRCIARLHVRLAGEGPSLGAPGWAGFFTARAELHVAALPARVPAMVAWGRGIRVAPYVRALRQRRPVVVAVADARSARVYAYVDGRVSPRGVFHVSEGESTGGHAGAAPRLGFHASTRGAAGSDVRARHRRAGKERMLREVARAVSEAAGADAWIALGGVTETARAVEALLPQSLRGRTRLPVGLDARAAVVDIERIAARVDEESSRARDLGRVERLRVELEPGGRAALGLAPTLEALREHAVARVYFSDAFARTHPLETEALVRAALREGAELDALSHAAAERLDEAGRGVAAELRWSMPPAPPSRSALEADGSP